MQNHPLTPMTDANLVRVLRAQSTPEVGLLRHDVVDAGVAATRERIGQLRASGVRLAVADAIYEADLRTLAAACAELPLITGGSGLALGLPAVYEQRGWIVSDASAAELVRVTGFSAVLSGSGSAATQTQVANWLASGRPGLQIDAMALAAGEARGRRGARVGGAALARRPGAPLCHR